MVTDHKNCLLFDWTDHCSLTNALLLQQRLKSLADQGHRDAQFEYGSLLLSGSGLSANATVAAHYFKLAADQGQVDAQLNYGVMLSQGDGISMNKSHAADGKYFVLISKCSGQIRLLGSAEGTEN
jgi:TPR repeat protein